MFGILGNLQYTTFQKGLVCRNAKHDVAEVVLPCKNGGKSINNVSSPLFCLDLHRVYTICHTNSNILEKSTGS